MIVRWLGHDCFLFYSKKGSRILTDPYGETISKSFPPLTCEVVVVSHEHPDHNAVWRVLGSPYVVKRTNPGDCEIEVPLDLTEETYTFKGISTYHDEVLGTKRGPNTVFKWEMDGYQICHLGDLGHILNNEQQSKIGKVDLLFLPVGGGGEVLTPKEATLVVDTLSPSLIFPMHYKSPSVDSKLENVGNFLKGMTQVEQMQKNQLEISTLPARPTVIVLGA